MFKNLLKRILHRQVIAIILVFLIGFYSSSVLSLLSTRENPFSVNSPEIHSPHSRIKEDQIKIYSDSILINLKNAQLAAYADTNSMDPVLDKGAIGIELIPENENELHLGDIIAFQNNNKNNNLIVHRIIKIGQDDRGKYFITKGDNNSYDDGIKIRFSQIKYVLAGILY